MDSNLRRVIIALTLTVGATTSMAACTDGGHEVVAQSAATTTTSASRGTAPDGSGDVTVPVDETTVPVRETTVPEGMTTRPASDPTPPGAPGGGSCWQDTDLDYGAGPPGSAAGPATAVEALQEMAAFAREQSDEFGSDGRMPSRDRITADARARSYEAILEHLDEATKPTELENSQTFAWTDAEVTVEIKVRNMDGVGWGVVNERYVLPAEVCGQPSEQDQA